MRKLLGQPVFAISGREFLWEDVLAAAALWSEWAAVVRRTRECLRVLAGEGPPPSDEEVESAAAEFRYARDLVSADEMEAWLERWGLHVDSWMAWVRAGILAAAGEAEEPREVQDGEEPEQEVGEEGGGEDADPGEPAVPYEQALLAQALFDGTLAKCAQWLAGRAAIADARGRLLEEASALPPPEELRDQLPELELLGLPRERWLERGRAVAALEEVFGCFRTELLSEAAVASRVRSHHADWTRVTYRALTLESEEAANEAQLAVRDDGLSMEEVARDAQLVSRQEHAFLCDVEDSLRAHLMASRKGDLVGPVRLADGWRLCLVVEKTAPSGEDPEVCRRAEHSLLAGALAREVDGRVSWRWTL